MPQGRHLRVCHNFRKCRYKFRPRLLPRFTLQTLASLREFSRTICVAPSPLHLPSVQQWLMRCYSSIRREEFAPRVRVSGFCLEPSAYYTAAHYSHVASRLYQQCLTQALRKKRATMHTELSDLAKSSPSASSLKNLRTR